MAKLRSWDPDHLLRSLVMIFVVWPVVLGLALWLLFAFGGRDSSKPTQDCPAGTFVENC